MRFLPLGIATSAIARANSRPAAALRDRKGPLGVTATGRQISCLDRRKDAEASMRACSYYSSPGCKASFLCISLWMS
jgi:hypothetical protein